MSEHAVWWVVIVAAAALAIAVNTHDFGSGHGANAAPSRTPPGYVEFDPLVSLRSLAECTWGASSVSAYVDELGHVHQSKVTTTGCTF